MRINLPAASPDAPDPTRQATTETVVYVGLRQRSAMREARAVTAAAPEAKVLTILTRESCPDEDVAGAVADIPLSGDSEEEIAQKRGALVNWLLQADPDARDELLQLIEVFSRAERGEANVRRLVISGHGAFDGERGDIWGEDNGVIGYEDIEQLCRQFPVAAAHVEHLALSACATSMEPTLAHFRKCFPNLTTYLGYMRAPTDDIAADDVARFIRKTAGLTPPDPKALAIGPAVAWTKSADRIVSGNLTYDAVSSAVLARRIEALKPLLEAYASRRMDPHKAHNDQKMIEMQAMLMTLMGRADISHDEALRYRAFHLRVRSVRNP